MTQIHPAALVDPQAELDGSVTVGAYSVIGPHVRIGAGTTVGPHCVIEGHTTLGRDNRIFQFASIGAAPQDKKYRGEPTRLDIGDGNTIREFVTINTGTVQDAGVTRVGDDNWIMAYAISRTIANWAATSSWRMRPRWAGMCTWATGCSWAA